MAVSIKATFEDLLAVFPKMYYKMNIFVTF